jgi:hypothetical protein
MEDDGPTASGRGGLSIVVGQFNQDICTKVGEGYTFVNETIPSLV